MQKKIFLGGALALALLASAGTATFAATEAANRPTFEQMQATHAAIQTAIESGDFAKFQAAIAADPRAAQMFASITAANFPKLQELHAAQLKVQQLSTELGLKHGFGPGGHGEGHDRSHKFGRRNAQPTTTPTAPAQN